jgi:hypothetical protein
MIDAARRIVSGLCGAVVLWSGPAFGAELVDSDLRATVSRFAESVGARDDAALDHAVCLDVLTAAQAERRVRLGLLDSREDPAFAESYRRAYRAAVYDRFGALTLGENAIESIDGDRVRAGNLGDEANEHIVSLGSVDDATASEITGSGILGVRFVGSERPVDIPVTRVGGRWCLFPVSPP